MVACAPSPGPTASSAPSAAAASATASQTPRRGGTFVTIIGGDPDTLNPNLTTGNEGIRAISGVYNGLVQIDQNIQAKPDLADSWTVSPDGKRWEFKLHPNVRFHDGAPFSSADVKFTVEEAAGKYNSLFLPVYQNIASVDTPDPNTVVFNLKAPSAIFLASLGVANINILQKKLYEGTDIKTNPANSRPIGTGPFKFKEWVKGDHIAIVRNDDYFKPGLPYLDQLVAKIIPDPSARIIAFQKGDADYLDATYLPREAVPDLRKLAGVQVNEHAGQPGNQLLEFNTKQKPLDDVRVRMAIAYGIDQKAIADKAYFGVGASPSVSHIMAELKDFHDPNTKIPHYDPAKASQLLDDVGLKRASDGTRFKLRLTFTSTLDPDRRTAEVIKDNMKDIGIVIDLQPVETAVLNREAFTNGNYDMLNVGLTSRGDPAIGIQRLYTTVGIGVGAGNGPRYSNPEVDDLFTKAAQSIDPAVRKEAYFKVQAILARDLPAFPLVDRSQLDVARPEVGGVFQAPYFYYRPDILWRKQ